MNAVTIETIAAEVDAIGPHPFKIVTVNLQTWAAIANELPAVDGSLVVSWSIVGLGRIGDAIIIHVANQRAAFQLFTDQGDLLAFLHAKRD